MDEKKHFICIKKPPRENFAETMTPEESQIMSQHFLYLKDLMEKGILVLAGPEISGRFGVSIYEAESIEHAKDLIANDPSVKKGLMKTEIYPFRISLLRK